MTISVQLKPTASLASAFSVPPLVQVEGLGKRLGGRMVIEGVSLAAPRGSFVAILGPSGAGKTTLFRCMTGLLRPDSGSVKLDGRDVHTLPARSRRRLAVVFQQFNLVSRLTALENVLAGRLGHVPAWRGMLRRFDRADRLLALECLERVGLLSHAGLRADRLSGGQQQRVAIARALAQRPDLIVADEPVASLDPTTGAAVLDLLREAVDRDGVGVICSLHQVHFAREYADHIIGMASGRVMVDRAASACDDAIFESLYRSAETG